MISIIIPIYNAASYLNRCIRSVIGQTHADLEIILVDDGSDDGSLQLCRKWEQQDSRIKVISQSNQGVSAARNAGLANATGQYIMFLDSDDCMKPDMCGVMLSMLEKKDVDLVICGTEENGGTYWKPKQSMDYLTQESFKFDFIRLLQTELLSPPWNKLYKKEKITSTFPVGVSFGEDLIFNLSYLKDCQRVSFIPDVLHFHEKENANSLTHNIDSQRLIDIETVQVAILDFYGKEQDKAYKKYVNDIILYTKFLLSDKTKSYAEKVTLLEKWRRNSRIDSDPVNNASVNWKNKLLLFFLQKRMWWSAYCIVQWKKTIADNISIFL